MFPDQRVLFLKKPSAKPDQDNNLLLVLAQQGEVKH